MIYECGGRKFDFSYLEMQEKYTEICEYSDEEFIEKVDDVLHFTVYTGYIKQWPSSMALCDTCLIHELVHLKLGDSVKPLEDIRELFAKICNYA